MGGSPRIKEKYVFKARVREGCVQRSEDLSIFGKVDFWAIYAIGGSWKKNIFILNVGLATLSKFSINVWEEVPAAITNGIGKKNLISPQEVRGGYTTRSDHPVRRTS